MQIHCLDAKGVVCIGLQACDGVIPSNWINVPDVCVASAAAVTGAMTVTNIEIVHSMTSVAYCLRPADGKACALRFDQKRLARRRWGICSVAAYKQKFTLLFMFTYYLWSV